MKRILVGVVLSAVVSFSASAQDGQHMRRSPEERANNQIAMMAPLNLTDGQKKDVYDINIKMAADMASGREEGNDNRRERMKGLQAKRIEAYRKILTPDQFAQFEKIQSEKRNQMKAATEQQAAEGQ